MADENLSLVLHKQNDLRLENTEIRDPSKGQVQVRSSHVGICGTDIHVWKSGSIGPRLNMTAPFILGHEASGVITKIGEGVTNFCVGDRVTMAPMHYCKMCDLCITGRSNICPRKKISGLYEMDGGLTRYHIHDADQCFKLPDNMSLKEGALIEPLSVATYAVKRAGVIPGSKVLISGAGTIGLLVLSASKAFGATQVCITDVNKDRLEKAKELGADVTVEVKTTDSEELASYIEQVMDGKPNIAIECSGASSGVKSAILATDSGGCVIIVGFGSGDIPIPLTDATLREVDIIGVNGYTNCFPIALAMMKTGKINADPIITNVFKLEQSLDAFEMVAKGEGIKVMIDCS